MRLAIVTQSGARIGGVEAYLEALLPALASHHQVAFCTASDNATARGAIAVPAGVQTLSVARSVDDLRAWAPDLVFSHGIDDAALEAVILGGTPSVAVEHTYHGTCISSSKTMTWPSVAGCDRPFGPACLGLYFPRRCGGANPLTMVRLYNTQSIRLRTLRNVAAVVTLSRHMADEMMRNGVRSNRVHVVPPFVHALPPSVPATGAPSTLLYLGRLERLKGVDRLLSALPLVTKELGRPVRLIVAGDGAERFALEHKAAAIRDVDPRVSIEFAGWQDETGRAYLFTEADALVVPSLWPEPFGLVGLEAAAAGVPAVGFATGGIPEWLKDGQNGCLAESREAVSEALASAIVRCIGDKDDLLRLSAGAARLAAEWTLEKHVAGLESVFEQALGTRTVIYAGATA